MSLILDLLTALLRCSVIWVYSGVFTFLVEAVSSTTYLPTSDQAVGTFDC